MDSPIKRNILQHVFQRKKKIEERVEDVTCTNPLEVKIRNKSNNKDDTFIDGAMVVFQTRLLD